MMPGLRRVAVIGGSGFIGHELVHALTRRGWRVHVGCRRPHRARELLIHQTRIRAVNAATGKGLEALLQGVEAVVYLAGILYEKGQQTFEAVHVRGVEHTIEAMRKLGVRRLVHVSALAAGEVPDSRYAKTKAEGEARVRASGLEWTIMRPSVVVGAGDGLFTPLKRWAKRLPFVPVIEPQARLAPVWVRDVARALAMSLEDPRAIGETFTLAGPKTYTMRELAELMLKTLGWRKPVWEVPSGLADLMARLGEWFPVPPLTREQLLLLRHGSVPKGEPFPSQFGEPARLEEVLPRFIHGPQAALVQDWLNRSRRLYRTSLMGTGEEEHA